MATRRAMIDAKDPQKRIDDIDEEIDGYTNMKKNLNKKLFAEAL